MPITSSCAVQHVPQHDSGHFGQTCGRILGWRPLQRPTSRYLHFACLAHSDPHLFRTSQWLCAHTCLQESFLFATPPFFLFSRGERLVSSVTYGNTAFDMVWWCFSSCWLSLMFLHCGMVISPCPCRQKSIREIARLAIVKTSWIHAIRAESVPKTAHRAQSAPSPPEKDCGVYRVMVWTRQEGVGQSVRCVVAPVLWSSH